MEIEKASASDAEEILALQKLAYRSEAELYNDYSIPPMTQTLDELRAEFDRQKFLSLDSKNVGSLILKAVIEGRVVGSVRAFSSGVTCFIGRLVVHPEFQNRGIGTLLMKEIEAQFRGCSRYELFTGMKSERNIRLYQKLGYRIFKDERVNDRLTMVFMEKTTT
ncbi:MAG: GNAT family N-acetyltransferase [Nitrososphaerales archaeon]